MLRSKGGMVKFLASALGFMGTKSLVQNQRTNITDNFKGPQVGGGLTDAQKQARIDEILSGKKSDSSESPPQSKSGDTKPQGLMRGLAGTADFLSFGLTDFDKRGDLIKGSSNKKDLNKQTNLALAEPAPEVIDMSAGNNSSSQSKASNTSGTGGMGGNVPRIPANNNDNSYIFSAYREYQIAPV